MNKILLFFTLSLFTFASHAQFDLKNYNDDSIITDGQTVSFSETGCGYDDDCNWKFKVTNTSTTETLYMRIFVDNMVNSDGSNVQLCFSGVCLFSVTLGSGYPNTAAAIAPGASTGIGNYFWNQNPISTTTAMSWTLRFQAFDSEDREIGTPLNVIYSFNPNLSVDDVELTSVNVYPTQVKNELNVSSNQDMTAEFYNVLGKEVKRVDVTSGESQINVSDLSPQLYIIRFRNEAGKTLIKKIIVE
ncbi:T9SS type A sorting domain-containing protein [Winogradskyella flava]|uniref:T9SS type A sorting domain-containing protein n=1 Tax=Winogradskyella flava TaxID=1884876 RepID=A0A842IRY0_9FLAO|nr:T9SS type A sorting domain-containing protein [Winogradskyella flava]MBC2844534.1 T9SS type A sorting domain-containing protein [Winogradskyella flava]